MVSCLFSLLPTVFKTLNLSAIYIFFYFLTSILSYIYLYIYKFPSTPHQNVSIGIVGKDLEFTIYDDDDVSPFLDGLEERPQRKAQVCCMFLIIA